MISCTLSVIVGAIAGLLGYALGRTVEGIVRTYREKRGQ